MSTYNTGNPVPSIDPRDLDDNATVFDLLLQSSAASVSDRLGAQRKTWYQMELDAAALVSPNVAALGAVTAAADKGVFFSAVSPVTMGTYTLTSFTRGLGAATDGSSFRAAIGAISSSDSITGSAASLTTSRSISITGDATWSVNFNGTANVTAALTLANSGVSAGTYGSVTVNAKGLVTGATTATPVANGGTGATTALAAGTNLGTAAVGTNTDQLAKSAMIQAEIANKRTWTSTTPTVTAGAGTFTTASATGSYMVVFGICHFRASVTITTKGTGTFPIITLPFPALSGSGTTPFFNAIRTANTKAGVGRITTGLTTLAITAYDGTDLLSADGDIINIYGSYPVA